MLAWSYAAEPARAQPVEMQIDPCVQVDQTRFRRLFAIELGGEREESDAADAARRATTVALSCRGSQVQLQLEDAVTRKSMTRLIDAGSVEPSARTRLMAVTVAEFVLASWLELRMFKQETIPPAGPEPSKAATDRASELADARIRGAEGPQLGAAFELLGFSSAFRPIPCLALQVAYPVSAELAVRFAAQLGYASLDGVAGAERTPVQVRLTIASLLATLSYTRRFDAIDVRAGVGVRVGFARLAGAASADSALESDAAFAPWAGPLVTLGAGYRVGDHVRIVSGIELGFVTLRPRAVTESGDVVTQLRGTWGGASLGVDWAF